MSLFNNALGKVSCHNSGNAMGLSSNSHYEKKKKKKKKKKERNKIEQNKETIDSLNQSINQTD